MMPKKSLVNYFEQVLLADRFDQMGIQMMAGEIFHFHPMLALKTKINKISSKHYVLAKSFWRTFSNHKYSHNGYDEQPKKI